MYLVAVDPMDRSVIIKKDYIAEMNKNELISIPGQCQDQTHGGN
jgi:hypothetical protein